MSYYCELYVKKNTYTSEIDKTFMEMVQYQIVLFLVKKVSNVQFMTKNE